MFRGFVFGILWGTVFGGLIFACLSLLSEAPSERVALDPAALQPFVEVSVAPLNVITLDIAETDQPLSWNDLRPQYDALTDPRGQFHDASSNSRKFDAPLNDAALSSHLTPALVDGNAKQDQPYIPPVIRFAELVQVDDSKSLLSIVLLDDPKRILGPSALKGLNIPVTIAVDATAVDAPQRALSFRKAGFEIVLAISLPSEITPSEVKSALPFFHNAVPEAVAILDVSPPRQRRKDTVMDTVSETLQKSGHGLLTQSARFTRVAETAGVATSIVERDLDGKGQNASAVRRFLSQAAFVARQDKELVVMARLRPETISALTQWSRQSRAQTVNIVPVSQVLNQ